MIHDNRNNLNCVIHPGDLCTVVLHRGEQNTRTGLAAVVVHRFWRSQKSEGGDQIIWFNHNEGPDPTLVSACPQIPTLLRRSSSSAEAEKVWNTSGQLEDGTWYYVYRFLLYCDDFSPRSALLPRGSVGGCYIRPVDL